MQEKAEQPGLLERIYSGTLEPVDLYRNGRLRETAEMLEQEEANFTESLADSLIARFQDYCVLREEKERLACVQAYREGFRLAARLLFFP